MSPRAGARARPRARIMRARAISRAHARGRECGRRHPDLLLPSLPLNGTVPYTVYTVYSHIRLYSRIWLYSHIPYMPIWAYTVYTVYTLYSVYTVYTVYTVCTYVHPYVCTSVYAHPRIGMSDPRMSMCDPRSRIAQKGVPGATRNRP